MVLSQRFASQGRIEETNAGFELVRKSEVQSFENRTKEKIHALTRKEMLPKIIIMSVIISIPVNSHLRRTWMPPRFSDSASFKIRAYLDGKKG